MHDRYVHISIHLAQLTHTGNRRKIQYIDTHIYVNNDTCKVTFCMSAPEQREMYTYVTSLIIHTSAHAF